MSQTQTSRLKLSMADQMAASLMMLHACVDRCPDDLWEAAVGERAFWEVAYHVTFFTDLYLTPHVDQYTGQPDWAWDHAAGLGHRMEPPFEALKPEECGPVLERRCVADYINDTIAKTHRIWQAETDETLAGESGFFWYPVTRLDMHLINLRHVMHHTGQLSAVLRKAGIAVDWTATSKPSKRE